MPTITDVLKKYISPSLYYYILIFIVLVIFIIAGVYGYKNYYLKSVNKKENPFANVANANLQTNEVIIYLFHVDWCPHCKTALPEWKQFMNESDGKQVKGHVIKCIDMNCTEESADVSKMLTKFNIESYPTIKMVKDGQIIEFDSKITVNSLDQFVDTMI